MLGNAKSDGIAHHFWSTGKGFVDLHRGDDFIGQAFGWDPRDSLLVLPQMQARHLGQDFQKQLMKEERE